MDFYLSVFDEIKNTGNFDKLKETHSKQKLNYYVKALKRAGLVRLVGYGTWETIGEYSEEKVKGKNKTTNVAHNDRGGYARKLPLNISEEERDKPIRGHGFVFKVKVPRESQKQYANREAILKENGTSFTGIPGKNTQRIMIGDNKIWLSDKTITFYFRESFFGKDANESFSKVAYHLKDRVFRLEKLLGISLQHKDGLVWKVSRQHYARIKSEIARQYDAEGKKLFVRAIDGTLWFLIDNSYNLHEHEAVNPIRAKTDIQIVENFLNSLRDNPTTIHDINGQIALSFSAIKNLTELVTKLTMEVEKLKE